MFVWLLLHGKILTSLERTRRGITVDPYCKCCPREDEDLNHIFRSCKKACPIWRHLKGEGVTNKNRPMRFMECDGAISTDTGLALPGVVGLV